MVPLLNKVRNILAGINKQPTRKIKVLTWPTHEGYQSNLGYLENVEFHLIHQPGGKKWDFHTRPLPRNHYLYTINPNEFRGETVFDYVLSQERSTQLPQALRMRDLIGIPVISLNHTEPYPGLSTKRLSALKSLSGDVNIYITEHNRTTWEDLGGIVIPHGIDDTIFNGYTGECQHGISLVNHFRERDVFCGWKLWEEISKQVPLRLIGENPGLSKSINKPTELVKEIGKARFFLNTSQLSPVPLSVIESCMVGIPLVSTAMQEIPRIFTHGENALLSNNINELIDYSNMLLKDKSLADRIGAAGRQLMIEKFGINTFVKNWENIFK